MRKLLYALTCVGLVSCGGNQVSSVIGSEGGELCLPDRRVCISVPLNGLPDNKGLYIRPSSDIPGGAISEVWEIGPNGTRFLKPATVTFRYDVLDGGLDNLNPSLVRLYTRELFDGGDYGDWGALDESIVDRVRLLVIGETMHLSPFTLMRTDRLSDGGIPIEGDAGVEKDAGVIICPPPCMATGDCSDMKLNNGESDIDCGGAMNMCVRCANGKVCRDNSDCASNRCVTQGTNKNCRAPVPDGGTGGGAGGGGGSGGGAAGGGAAGGGAGGGAAGGGAAGGGAAGGGAAGGGAGGGAAGGGAAGGGAAGGGAGGGTAVVDAGSDAGIDAGIDAGVDAGFDGGVDAGEDAGCQDAGDGGCL